MSKKVDYHKKGEQDRSKSAKRTGFVDIVCDQIFGGSYRPPKERKAKDQYKKGWNNR